MNYISSAYHAKCMKELLKTSEIVKEPKQNAKNLFLIQARFWKKGNTGKNSEKERELDKCKENVIHRN